MDLTRKQGQRYDFFATVAHVFTRSTQCPVVVNASTRINDESSQPNTILHFIQLQTESSPEAVPAPEILKLQIFLWRVNQKSIKGVNEFTLVNESVHTFAHRNE